MKNDGPGNILIIEDEKTGSTAATVFENHGLRDFQTDLAPDLKPKEGESLFRAVVVQSPVQRPVFEALGLEPEERIVSLSRFRDILPGLRPNAGANNPPPVVLFLLGLGHEGHPASTREVLECASLLQGDTGHRVIVLYANLKVSGAGLEAGVREARRKGVLFFRFSNHRPRFTRDHAGRTTVEWKDEAGRMQLQVHPAWIVVDEAREAGPGNLDLASSLHAYPGPDGFLPSDNVYRLGLQTNRRGIVGILPDADPLGRDTQEDDVAAAMLEMRAIEHFDRWAPHNAAVIDARLCARCLTCYRSCPHGAVALGERIQIIPEACFACGICEAACPARAIALRNRSSDETDAHAITAIEYPTIHSGDVVAFGCRRSADRARALCRHLGHELPQDLVFVPVDCAGRISGRMLLDPLLSDASGVLVLACHPGNCHSERGNIEARARVQVVRRSLEELGLDPERLRFATLAANMGTEFGRMVQAFREGRT